MNPIRLVTLAAFCGFGLIGQTTELKLDDIVKRSVDAQGGLTKIRAIQSMKLTGKMILGGGQMEVPLTTYMKRPHSNRTEFTLQNQRIVDAYDGTIKWSINPMTGSPNAQKASDEDTAAAVDDSDIAEGPLADYQAKGNALELQGKEDIDGSMAYKIKVTFKSGRTRMVFVDQTTFLIVKEITKVKAMGQEYEAETLPGNYKKVNGVMIPHSSAMKVNQQVAMRMEFENVEVNVPVDDALFAFPAEPKKADPPKVQ